MLEDASPASASGQAQGIDGKHEEARFDRRQASKVNVLKKERSMQEGQWTMLCAMFYMARY